MTLIIQFIRGFFESLGVKKSQTSDTCLQFCSQLTQVAQNQVRYQMPQGVLTSVVKARKGNKIQTELYCKKGVTVKKQNYFLNFRMYFTIASASSWLSCG